MALIGGRGLTHAYPDFVWNHVHWNKTKKYAKQGKKGLGEQILSVLGDVTSTPGC